MLCKLKYVQKKFSKHLDYAFQALINFELDKYAKSKF